MHTCTGDDTYGRKVIVFSACNMPPREDLDHKKLLRCDISVETHSCVVLFPQFSGLICFLELICTVVGCCCCFCCSCCCCCCCCLLFGCYYGRPASQMRTLYICPVVSIFLSIFCPRLISAAADWMSTILRHMVWP